MVLQDGADILTDAARLQPWELTRRICFRPSRQLGETSTIDEIGNPLRAEPAVALRPATSIPSGMLASLPMPPV